MVKYIYQHIGIPTKKIRKGMAHIKHLKIYANDHESNQFGIQWMKYEKGCKVPKLVKEVPHIAFIVDNLNKALKGRKVIIKPNSPSPGVMVAFVEIAGAPVEFLEYKKKRK